jgi:hypothetical protein
LITIDETRNLLQSGGPFRQFFPHSDPASARRYFAIKMNDQNEPNVRRETGKE